MRQLAVLFLSLLSMACTPRANGERGLPATTIQVGADRIEKILAQTKGKRVALTTNQTGVLSNAQHTFLADTLLRRGVTLTKLFTPEHGLRGNADAGEQVISGIDPESGLPVVSLYGDKKKPATQDLRDVDVMLFDLQDVGCRFYTYISTMYYVMEACAEAGIPIVILDRPNPHDTIDGAVLKEDKYRSFVSQLNIPALHGLTLGEAARMINGEHWLTNGIQAELTVIEVKGWSHGDPYSLPIPPSPNLKSDRAILLYPTLCYYEGTEWSVGRGTDHPFEVIGYPDERAGEYRFTPEPKVGASKPMHLGKRCYGPDISTRTFESGIDLNLLLETARITKKMGKEFVTRRAFFDLLAGNGSLADQIQEGLPADSIRADWKPLLVAYHALRANYLLYPDERSFYFLEP